MIALTNGKIILKDKILDGHVLIINNEKIEKIIPSEEFSAGEDVEIIDCKDKYISPGIIDIHSDYIENIVSPRPTTMMDFEFALRETERILVTSGITTMYHSISLNSLNNNSKKKVRHSENVLNLVEEINELDKKPHIIHNRVHIRYEISCIELIDEILRLISENKIHLFSLMDHTPGQGQYRNIEVYKEIKQSYNESLSESDIEREIDQMIKSPKLLIEDMKRLTDACKENNITVASHDDDSIEKLSFNENLGVKISEFPLTIEIAKEARNKGFFTVAGAPNLLLGKSHSGNLSAKDGIKHGTISIISSDYYPSSMLYSLFKTSEELDIPLYEMFNMVTYNPAKAVGISDLYGSIEVGKNADIIVIESFGKYPTIDTAMIDGRVVFRTEYRNEH